MKVILKKIYSTKFIIILIALNILLSFCILAANWIFLDEYIKYMSEIEIVNTNKDSVTTIGYIIGLGFRTFFSLFWIFTFLLLRRLIIKRVRGIWWVLLIYGVISICVYSYYVFINSFYIFTCLRVLQLLVSLGVFLIIFTKPLRSELKLRAPEGGEINE